MLIDPATLDTEIPGDNSSIDQAPRSTTKHGASISLYARTRGDHRVSPHVSPSPSCEPQFCPESGEPFDFVFEGTGAAVL
jgi:hypothetical protein